MIFLTVMNLYVVVKVFILTIHQSSWFFSLQGNFKILGIGSLERSWGDVKKIKSGKRSALGSEIYERQRIVYTSACIEESRIGGTISHTDSKEIHTVTLGMTRIMISTIN